MNVVILGGGGQLASDLVPALSGWTVTPLGHDALDVTDAPAVSRVLGDLRPDVVIDTAAFHRVDDCEDQIDRTFAINTFAVKPLAQICAELRCVLVYISTDYVFDGRQQTPYLEDDPVHPLNVYGVSKAAGEQLALTYCPRTYVVRSSGLYGVAGASGKGGNFVETMIRLAQEGKPIRVVGDQVLAPTFTVDLARKIVQLLTLEAPHSLYHITNAGQCSWFEFASRIFALLGLAPDLAPTTSAAYAARARRPAYSVLGHVRLDQAGLDNMRPWHAALRTYLQEKKYL